MYEKILFEVTLELIGKPSDITSHVEELTSHNRDVLEKMKVNENGSGRFIGSTRQQMAERFIFPKGQRANSVFSSLL